jgi:hypothetical protein
MNNSKEKSSHTYEVQSLKSHVLYFLKQLHTDDKTVITSNNK